jgi:hypothetical protein
MKKRATVRNRDKDRVRLKVHSVNILERAPRVERALDR